MDCGGLIAICRVSPGGVCMSTYDKSQFHAGPSKGQHLTFDDS